MLSRVQQEFARCGYEVQSRRVFLDHWDLGLTNLAARDRGDLLQRLDDMCAEAEIDFCSVGLARAPADIEQMAHVIAGTRHLNGTAEIGSEERGVDQDAVRAAAEAIKHLSYSTPDGLGNFRFGSASCLRAGTPFFPGSFHDGGPAFFSIGLQNSDLLVRAFNEAGTLHEATKILHELLTDCCQGVVKVADRFASTSGLQFRGLDTSIAPTLDPAESIALAFDAIGTRFGEPGTLAICGAITRVLQSIPVPRVGYCGIMLSVLEDVGLAAAGSQNRFDVTDLLAYSSVCAVGIDMVPLAGDCPTTTIEHILSDVGTLSVKLKKQLTARLLPVPGKSAGETTEFASAFMCNGSILKI
jgi:uncharacterized protein (UPF0210 family)